MVRALPFSLSVAHLPLSPLKTLRRLLLSGDKSERGQGHAAGQGQARRERVLKRGNDAGVVEGCRVVGKQKNS